MANLEVPEYDAYAAAPSGDALLEDGTVVGLTPNQRAPRDDQRENTSMRLTWAAHASCARAPPRREKKSAGIGRPGPPQAAQGLSEPARLDQPRRRAARPGPLRALVCHVRHRVLRHGQGEPPRGRNRRRGERPRPRRPRQGRRGGQGKPLALAVPVRRRRALRRRRLRVQRPPLPDHRRQLGEDDVEGGGDGRVVAVLQRQARVPRVRRRRGGERVPRRQNDGPRRLRARRPGMDRRERHAVRGHVRVARRLHGGHGVLQGRRAAARQVLQLRRGRAQRERRGGLRPDGRRGPVERRLLLQAEAVLLRRVRRVRVVRPRRRPRVVCKGST
mmetsp:Transcript_10746/g.33099  ORF Transcript_10746/g.33099 Transcript_10746/m.33099 type:complete len:331 (-) Transcript_10746:13-1005(-)